jgi:hypothetical protein
MDRRRKNVLAIGVGILGAIVTRAGKGHWREPKGPEAVFILASWRNIAISLIDAQ